MKSPRPVIAIVCSAVLWTGCASIKPPTVRVAGIHLDGVSITGARVDVGLDIRNVNPGDLQIERFEYEVKLNGQTLGRGFGSEPLQLGGFKEGPGGLEAGREFPEGPGCGQEVSRTRTESKPKSRALSMFGRARDSERSSSAATGTSTSRRASPGTARSKSSFLPMIPGSWPWRRLTIMKSDTRLLSISA